MKLIVRTSVLALVAAAAFASTTQASKTSTTSLRSHQLTPSAAPVPFCPPTDPNACGFGGNKGK